MGLGAGFVIVCVGEKRWLSQRGRQRLRYHRMGGETWE